MNHIRQLAAFFRIREISGDFSTIPLPIYAPRRPRPPPQFSFVISQPGLDFSNIYLFLFLISLSHRISTKTHFKSPATLTASRSASSTSFPVRLQEIVWERLVTTPPSQATSWDSPPLPSASEAVRRDGERARERESERRRRAETLPCRERARTRRVDGERASERASGCCTGSGGSKAASYTEIT